MFVYMAYTNILHGCKRQFPFQASPISVDADTAEIWTCAVHAG